MVEKLYGEFNYFGIFSTLITPLGTHFFLSRAVLKTGDIKLSKNIGFRSPLGVGEQGCFQFLVSTV